MITIKDYSISQSNNSIEIKLPQTFNTLSNTYTSVSDRRVNLSDDELSLILSVVVQLFEIKKE